MLSNVRTRLLGDERGFTMVTVMLSMMVLSLFAVSAWGMAKNDIPAGRSDQDRERAYEAAQAGVEWYSYQLQRDPAYWQKCASITPTDGTIAPVTLEGKTPIWRTLTDADGAAATQEQFHIEILDTKNTSGTKVPCSTSDPSGTALANGSLRIRVTGRANGKYRSVIATYRRTGFLNFIYFTQWETQDPIISGASNCDRPRSTRGSSCVVIQFQNADKIKGPMHTNDESVVTCGSPAFGRAGKSDSWEIAGAAPGYVTACGNYTPTFNGPKVTPAGTLTMPDGNTQLSTLAGDWNYSGQTCLKFKNDNTVDIFTNQNWASGKKITCTGTPINRSLVGSNGPPNGVIYVSGNGTCGYSRTEDYSNPATCGDVAVSGTYGTSVTIGAANDIIVNGDVVHAGDAMMGLIAANFVRIYHPFANRTSSSCGTQLSGTDYTPIKQVDAAILALQHSFVVDNYDCGAAMTDALQVNGAIAQYYRGTVGTGSGTTISTGYAKDYNYDDRLKFQSPPNFLDPVETRWEIVRKSEQQPANTQQ